MSHINFTSETLRLEPNSGSTCGSTKESDRTNNQHLQSAVLSASQGYQKKKGSSFQITSIRPTSRSSNDGADDSENDTEDTSDILDSSRITIDVDQETPSFSEDISKSEELLLGSGPVIPTSSQYGITALVQQTGPGGMMTARLPQGVTVNVTDGGLALAKADGEPDDLDNWQKRFKIVKIDSTEPFKRGRWICVDFMDSPALSSSENKSEQVPNLVVSNVMISDPDSNEKHAPSFIQIPLSLSSASTTQQYPAGVTHSIPTQYGAGQVPMSAASSQIPSGPVHGSVHYTPTGGHPMQGVVSGYTATPVSSTASQVTLATNVHSTGADAQSTSVVTSSSSQGSVPVCAGVPTPHSVSSNQQPLVPVSIPSEPVPQNTMPPTAIRGVTGMQQPVIGISAGALPPSGLTTPQQPSVSSTQVLSQSISPQQSAPAIPSGQQKPIGSTSVPSGSSSQSTPVVSTQMTSVAGATSAPSTIQAASYPSVPGAVATPATTPAQPQISLGSGAASETLPTTLSVAPTLEGIVRSTQADATGPSAAPDEAESASTASTVAIDNKIEQAMDLVKSHLMFAVREEVDVLKDRIVELMDRIKHLECENTILRQYASPEVLQQIQSQIPHQLQQPPHHSSTS